MLIRPFSDIHIEFWKTTQDSTHPRHGRAPSRSLYVACSYPIALNPFIRFSCIFASIGTAPSR